MTQKTVSSDTTSTLFLSEPMRLAFDKVDSNFTELYASAILSMSTARLLGRVTAGSGAIEQLTATQATTLINTFTSGLKGVVPASGGGTANFLRADGTFAAPAGGTPGGTDGQIQVNSASTFAGIDPSTSGFVLTSGGAGVAPTFQATVVPSNITGSKTAVGAWLFANEVAFNNTVVLKSRIYPTTLAAGDTNNFDNANAILSLITRLMLDPDAAAGSALTGMRAPDGGAQAIWIFNIGTGATANLTLKHQAGGSSAANQFICPGEIDFVIRAGGGVLVVYDETGYAKWRVCSP